jgi:hypothetical protein
MESRNDRKGLAGTMTDRVQSDLESTIYGLVVKTAGDPTRMRPQTGPRSLRRARARANPPSRRPSGPSSPAARFTGRAAAGCPANVLPLD